MAAVMAALYDQNRRPGRGAVVELPGMRIARVIVLLWLAGGVAACKDRGEASAAPDPAALKAQQELIKRRDALLEQRQKLESQRKVVLEQIAKVEASGGDTRELTKQRDDLTAQIDGQSDELGQMSDKLSSLSTKLDSAADVAAREDRIAQREKETCGTAPPMIIQSTRADGKYTKADVQPLLARARATMSKKGILVADLPAPAQDLEGESTRAMAEGDWGKAYFAAAQLVA